MAAHPGARLCHLHAGPVRLSGPVFQGVPRAEQMGSGLVWAFLRSGFRTFYPEDDPARGPLTLARYTNLLMWAAIGVADYNFVQIIRGKSFRDVFNPEEIEPNIGMFILLFVASAVSKLIWRKSTTRNADDGDAMIDWVLRAYQYGFMY